MSAIKVVESNENDITTLRFLNKHRIYFQSIGEECSIKYRVWVYTKWFESYGTIYIS